MDGSAFSAKDLTKPIRSSMNPPMQLPDSVDYLRRISSEAGLQVS